MIKIIWTISLIAALVGMYLAPGRRIHLIFSFIATLISLIGVAALIILLYGGPFYL